LKHLPPVGGDMEHRAAGVASQAIEFAVRGKVFTVRDVQRGLSDPPSRQTVYRVLRQLASDDWIRRESHLWHPDIKATMLGDVDDTERRGGFSLSADNLLDE